MSVSQLSKCFSLVTLVFVVCGKASATTLGGGSVSDLSQEAGWIGRVQVQSVDTIASSSEFPFSRVRGKILEVFKGSGSINEAVTFQVPGGQRGRKFFAVLGFPNFRPGGEYIVFLEDEPRLSSTAMSLSSLRSGLVGWTAFRVVHSESSAVNRMVMRAGEPTLLQNSDAGRTLIHDRSIKTYDDFVAEIYRSLD